MCDEFGGRKKGHVDGPRVIVFIAVAGAGAVCEGWGEGIREIYN